MKLPKAIQEIIRSNSGLPEEERYQAIGRAVCVLAEEPAAKPGRPKRSRLAAVFVGNTDELLRLQTNMLAPDRAVFIAKTYPRETGLQPVNPTETAKSDVESLTKQIRRLSKQFKDGQKR